MPLIGRRTFMAGAAAAALSRTSAADDYPSRPVTLIIPFPPGGSTTIVIRSVSDKLGEGLGQQIVIDNRAGAGGTVGTRALSKSEPDGYTIGLGYTGTLAIGPNLYSNVGYDPRRDFSPIGRIATAPNTLVVNPSFPAKTVPELIAYAKANPGKISMASSGIGSTPHLAGELFKMMAGVDMVHVPYRGQGPALSDLIGGQVQILFAAAPGTVDYVKTNKLRALAVTTAARMPDLPDVPTVADTVAAYEASQWYGFAAPRNTPTEIVEKLNKEINAAIADGGMKAKLAAIGGDPMPGKPAEFGKLIADETEKWGKVVRAAGLKPE